MTGHHEARDDKVEDVVEFASLDANRERDIDVDFRTAVVALLVSLGWYSCNTRVLHAVIDDRMIPFAAYTAAESPNAVQWAGQSPKKLALPVEESRLLSNTQVC